MEISGTIVQPLSIASARRVVQPVADTNGQLPARQEQRDGRTTTRDAALLIERYASPITSGPVYPRNPVHHTQHAIQAYTALERSEELQYVSRVLGIDEYA